MGQQRSAPGANPGIHQGDGSRAKAGQQDRVILHATAETADPYEALRQWVLVRFLTDRLDSTPSF